MKPIASKPLLRDPPNPPMRGWYKPHHTTLYSWIRELPLDPDRPATAVFDWDNTCIFNDIGEITFRYQLEHLALRLTPKAMEALLNLPVGGPTYRALLDFKKTAHDVLSAYQALWPGMSSGPQQGEDLAGQGRGSPAHRDFRAKAGCCYEALKHGWNPDPGHGLDSGLAYLWVARWLTGFHPQEIQRLAQRAWTVAAQEPPGYATWSSASCGAAGRQSYRYRTHVALHLEMQDLIAALQACGVLSFVVTASPTAVVQGVLSLLHHPLPTAHVFGMQVPEPTWFQNPCAPGGTDEPIAYCPSKVGIIQRFLPAPPLLVAGDQSPDYGMLTSWGSTQIRLLINCNAPEPLRTLYRAALAPQPCQPFTLLQGRDENHACFRPALETIPLGQSQPTALSF